MPLDTDVIDKLNSIIADLPGNWDSEGHCLISTVNQLDLNADELNLIVSEPHSVEFVESENEKKVEEEEEKPETVDVKQIRADLKRSYETILYHTIALDEKEIDMLKVVKRKLNEIRSEEEAEKKTNWYARLFSLILNFNNVTNYTEITKAYSFSFDHIILIIQNK